jgi:hypothetical protein
MENENESFEEWYSIGLEKGWITKPFCQTHDGGYDYMTEEEVKEWEEGGDPCMTVTRIKYLG